MNNEFVKVPFKREEDGTKTYFLPGNCRMAKGYEIGYRNRDKEKGIQSYWEALEKLLTMSQPRFRRRNKNGNFGTVACENGDVDDVSRDFIEQERAKYGG